MSFTNAPPHWPRLPEDALKPQEALAAALRSGLSKSTVVKTNQSFLTENGRVFNTQVTVEEGDLVTPVFALPAGEYQARRFLGRQGVAEDLGLSSPVWYSRGDLPHVSEAIDPTLDHLLIEYLNPGCASDFLEEFHIWWPVEESKEFSDSPLLKSLDRLYESSSEYSSWIYFYLLKQLKLIPPHPSDRLDLPGERRFCCIIGPSEIRIIIAVSREQGFVPYFNRERTDGWQRDTIVSLLAAGFEKLTMWMQGDGIKKDPKKKREALKWWTSVRDDPSRALSSFGKITGDGRGLRWESL